MVHSQLAKNKSQVATYKDALRASLAERVTKHDEEKQELDNEFLAKLEVITCNYIHGVYLNQYTYST